MKFYSRELNQILLLKLVDVQIIYKKLYQRELVTSDWYFVIRNSSGVQIFRNDEKARQRHLPKMYTLVVTMNWNRFRNFFFFVLDFVSFTTDLNSASAYNAFDRTRLCGLFQQLRVLKINDKFIQFNSLWWKYPAPALQEMIFHLLPRFK